MMMMVIISLLTDFGLIDGYPGIMKGVIYSIAPAVRIADVTHLISPQNVREGAIAVSRAYRYFPAGSIHVAVVDPGVGTYRRPLAMRLGDHFFIGPDNGLFSLVIQEAKEKQLSCQIVAASNQKYWLPKPSHVFHGRDIFAPVAAHLGAGVRLDQLGEPVNDPILLPFPRPVITSHSIQGEVIAIDHFGNLSTNILDTDIPISHDCTVEIAGCSIRGMVKTFGDRPAGELVALIGTDHDLSISIVNGNAQAELSAGVGEKIVVTFG